MKSKHFQSPYAMFGIMEFGNIGIMAKSLKNDIP